MDKSRGGYKGGFKWSDEWRDELRLAIELGLSRSQIARRMSARLGVEISKNSVVGACHRMGITTPRKPKKIKPPVAPKAVQPERPVVVKITKEMAKEIRNEVVDPIGPMNDFSQSGTCHYIHGEPGHTDWQCCGHKVAEGSPYCVHHTIVCNAIPRERPPEQEKLPVQFKRWTNKITGYV